MLNLKRSGDRITGHVLGLVFLLALTFTMAGPTAAARAQENAADPARFSGPVVTHAKPAVVKATSAADACPVTAYGYTGYAICDFIYSTYDWGGGNLEYFVVGTDYQIWHAWKGSGGWHSLGGQASRATPNGAYAYAKGVATYGTDRNLWCRDHPWTNGWRRC